MAASSSASIIQTPLSHGRARISEASIFNVGVVISDVQMHCSNLPINLLNSKTCNTTKVMPYLKKSLDFPVSVKVSFLSLIAVMFYWAVPARYQ